MHRFRVSSLQWMAGAYCALVGTLMLIVPHHLDFPDPVPLPVNAGIWGALYLLTGISLFSLAVIKPPRGVAVMVHWIAALLLLRLAAGYFGAEAWMSPLHFLALAAGITLASLSTRSVKQGYKHVRGDFLSLTAGLCAGLSGLLMLGLHYFPGLDSILSAPSDYTLEAGIVFLTAGITLVGIQLWMAGSTGQVRIHRVNDAAHLMLGVVFLIFPLAASSHERQWIATTFYWVTGAALILMPRLIEYFKRNSPHRLYMRLALVLATATALPLIITVGFVSQREERLVTAEVMGRQESHALVIARGVSDFVALHRAALQTLARQPDLMNLRQQERLEILQMYARSYPHVSALAIYGPGGQLVAGSGVEQIDGSIAGTPLFDQVRETRQSSRVIRYYPAIEDTALILVEPVLSQEGAFLGVVALRLPVAELGRFVDITSTRPAGAYLVSDSGILVYYPGLGPAPVDLSDRPGLLEFLSGEKRTASTILPRPTQRLFVSYSRIPELGWSVVVEVTSSEALAGVRAGRDLAFFILAIFLCLTTFSGIVIAGWLTAPLNALSKAANALGAGIHDSPLPHTDFVEIQRLADAFGSMRQRLAQRKEERERALFELQKAKDELEIRVSERTADLQEANVKLEQVNTALSQVNLELERELEVRRRAETALSNSERQLRTVLENLPVGVWLSDARGKLVYGNPAGRRIWTGADYPDKDLFAPDLDWREFSDLRILPEDWAAMRSMQDGAAILNEEVEITSLDGSRRIILSSVVPIYDDHQQITGAVVVNEDITLRKQAEQALQDYASQLERSNQDLQDFAFIASHDLQEPLRKIRAFASLLQNDYGTQLGDQGCSYLERMQDAVIRMQKMINDLLDYSRVNTGANPFTQVDMGQVVQEVLSDLETSIAESRAQVQIDQLPTLEADPLQMRQLMQNLISNAIKFHRPGEDVRVHIFADGGDGPEGITGDMVRIHVQDNGVGFDLRHLDRIFQPFERLHGRGTFKGSGIGLALCRKIAERHQGSITAVSAPGEGSTFTILLPRRQSPAVSDEDL